MTRQGHASDVMVPFISVTKNVTTWICLPCGYEEQRIKFVECILIQSLSQLGVI